jgi:hypothetical protein
MWRQRYDNEALYPYNGPVANKRLPSRIHSRRREYRVRRPVQLKMQLKTA